MSIKRAVDFGEEGDSPRRERKEFVKEEKSLARTRLIPPESSQRKEGKKSGGKDLG